MQQTVSQLSTLVVLLETYDVITFLNEIAHNSRHSKKVLHNKQHLHALGFDHLQSLLPMLARLSVCCRQCRGQNAENMPGRLATRTGRSLHQARRCHACACARDLWLPLSLCKNKFFTSFACSHKDAMGACLFKCSTSLWEDHVRVILCCAVSLLRFPHYGSSSPLYLCPYSLLLFRQAFFLCSIYPSISSVPFPCLLFYKFDTVDKSEHRAVVKLERLHFGGFLAEALFSSICPRICGR